MPYIASLHTACTFFKLVGNSTLKKTLFQRMWRNIVFPSMWLGYFLLAFFLFLFVSISLVCVLPWSATWIFTSNLKVLILPGLSVSSISAGAIHFVSKSFTNSSMHPLYHSVQHPITLILGPLRQKVFFGYYSFFDSLHIKFSQIHYN